jgi:hypothetical protein
MSHDEPSPPAVARRAWVMLCLVVALMVVASVAGRHRDAPPSGRGTSRILDQASVNRAQGRRDTVAELLSRRADALREKDRVGFLATVDRADSSFFDAQADWFDNLAEVPFDSWSLTLGGHAMADVPPQASTRVARLAAGTLAAPVDVSYRITKYDNAAQHYEQVLTFSPRGARWFVSGTFDPLGSPAHRELWDVGKVHVLVADHGLILGLDPAQSLRAYARQIDREVPVVSATWAHPWAEQVLVEVTRTEEEMATLLGGTPAAYRQLAAVTRGELGTAEATSAAERIIVNPRAYGQLSGVGRQVIMGHEITHVAVRASTQSWTPRWLAEGLADYVGYQDSGLSTKMIAQELATDVQRGLLPGVLPDDTAFLPSESGLAQSYEMSWLACRMIAERYGGPEVLVAFYRAVGEPNGASGMGRAFHDVLATTPEAFTAAWRDYVRSELN